MTRVLLGVTGGIAAFKAPALVRQLRASGHEVRCALSRAASQFVTPLTLEVLSENAVLREEYLRANGSGEELHITAAQWADVVCIAPATTHTLVRIAHGLADDFLTTTLTAFTGPLVVAPAMHTHMWERATTQQAVDRLRSDGVVVVGPETGKLASGEIGTGRMADPETVAAAVDRMLAPKDYAGVKAVVTAGPTHEALDPVRFLGNRSSGKMGFAIAEALAMRGAQVRLIAGPTGLSTPPWVERVDVVSAHDMGQALQHATERVRPELLVMCAAVADYRPRDLSEQKIKRGQQTELSVDLVANSDLLASLAEMCPTAVRVGFAAETQNLIANATNKLRAKQAHFLCANDVSRADIGFDAEQNQLTVFGDDDSRVDLPKQPKRQLAHALLDVFRARVQNQLRLRESS